MQQKLSRSEQRNVKGGIAPGPCNTICWLVNGTQATLSTRCTSSSNAFNLCYATYGDNLNCARCSCWTGWVC
jgi:hypothetical protein